LRASIERGLADSAAGRVVTVEELMSELGIAD
jgi:predicted transcriptional regulator